MSSEQISIITEGIIPFKDSPFKASSSTEREHARSVANQIRDWALAKIANELEVRLDTNEGDPYIAIMSAELCKLTGYVGADVVVEKWRKSPNRSGNIREFSYAFYPNFVINRPNYNCYFKISKSDGSVEIIEDVDLTKPETYEVGKKELEDLFETLQKYNQYRLFAPLIRRA